MGLAARAEACVLGCGRGRLHLRASNEADVVWACEIDDAVAEH